MAMNPRQAAYDASKKPTPKPMPTKTAKAIPLTPERRARAGAEYAEKLLQKYLNQGMSLDKARKKVSSEIGIWPNGYTN